MKLTKELITVIITMSGVRKRYLSTFDGNLKYQLGVCHYRNKNNKGYQLEHTTAERTVEVGPVFTKVRQFKRHVNLMAKLLLT